MNGEQLYLQAIGRGLLIGVAGDVTVLFLVLAGYQLFIRLKRSMKAKPHRPARTS